MTEFVYFLGRFHVLVVHLPIGILLLAAVLEVARLHPRLAGVGPALPMIWLAGAISALLTVIVGYMHATEGGFDQHAIDMHRWSASGLTLLAFAVWALRAEPARPYARAWPAVAAACMALLFATGHYGGNLTHGPTYLVEYAPGPLRAWAGVSDEEAGRPRVASLGEADVFLDVVGPTLRARCSSCHNDSRRRGDLSLVGYDAILAGGESGAVIVPGAPEESDIYRRVTLPEEHVDFMPKNGKPPLTPEEAAALRWWIEIGAPRAGVVDQFAATGDSRSSVAAVLGLADEGGAPVAGGE